MRFFFALCVAVIGVIASGAPASAKPERLVLQPSSQWVVEFSENNCQLMRNFGDGEEKHALIFRQWKPSTGFAFTAAGPGFKRFISGRKTYLGYSPNQSEPRETQPLVGKSEIYGPTVVYSNLSFVEPNADNEKSSNAQAAEPNGLPQLSIDDVKATTQISLRQRSREVVFEMGALANGFEVLNACTQDLMKTWGLDVEKHRTASRLPEPQNLKRIVRQMLRDYPEPALWRGQQGIFKVRVMIDETGKATQCIINQVTVADKIDGSACEPLMKAIYPPALDAQGEPFKSYYATTITYRIN